MWSMNYCLMRGEIQLCPGFLNRDGVSKGSPLLAARLTYVTIVFKVTYMEKTQIYFRKEELAALRKAAARSGRSVAQVVREAVRKVILRPNGEGPVAIWDGQPRRPSIDHDSIYDET